MHRLRVASKAIRKPKRLKEKSPGSVRFLKSRGQHVLKNPQILQAIVDKAGIKNTDVILEIGPGTGNLTVKLLEKAKKVIAIEVDQRLILELQRRIQNTEAEGKLEIIHADVLKMELPYFDCCVANIPYNISSPLVFKLLSHRPMFRSATLMFQREFAMRMVASAGDSLYCRLALNVQLLARVSHLMKIGRNNFVPPPKVDSSLVRIEPRNPLPPIDFLEWDGLTKICFCRKNKTLGAVFRHGKLLKKLETQYRLHAALELGTEERDNLVTTFENLGMETTTKDASSDDEDETMINAETEDVSFKERVVAVLDAADFVDKRPAKMTQAEFMLLLSRFNAAGIHFVD